jgi:hypothetical protein
MLTIRGVNADLADTAVALTAVLAAHPEQLELHVTARAEQGRRPWQTNVRMESTELTSVLVTELHALIGSTLHALRTNVIMEPTERLSAYEAIDLASRRAAAASELVEQHSGTTTAAAL